ncbi:hypothetical protein [Streptomyces sp. NPDC051098]|uniref:hypothetical protein n=1 Tax=Streptomyces sp. NPDC051098 TaxID=3155411 RepID=UPI003449C9B4
MFNRLQVGVLPPGHRWPAQAQLRIDGEDAVAQLMGEGGRGPLADDVLPPGGLGPLWATGEGRRVELGEPECTGGCCGFLSVFVQRHGDVVEWSDWQTPGDEPRPPEFHFEADLYDAELTRALAERRRQLPTA